MKCPFCLKRCLKRTKQCLRTITIGKYQHGLYYKGRQEYGSYFAAFVTIIAVTLLISLIGNVLYELFSLKVTNITRNYYNDDSQWIGEREFITKLRPQFNFTYEMVILPEYS